MLGRQQPHARAFIARAARQSPDGFRRTGDHATEGQRLDGRAQVPGRDVHQAGFFFAATFLTAFLVAFFAAFLTAFFTAPAAAFGLAAVLVVAFFAAPRSEEHTSELQSLMRISYAVFCLKKKRIRRVTS